MREDDKEKWIEQLQNKLDGYSEEVPDNVWGSLEKRYAPNVVPLWKRWQNIAAVVLLLMASSTLVYLWNMSVPSDYIQQEQEKLASDIRESTDMDGDIEHEQLAVVKEEGISYTIPAKSRKLAVVEMNMPDKEENGISKESPDERKDIEEKEEACEILEQVAIEEAKKPERNGRYTYNAQPTRKSKKWSVAINSEGMGVSSTSNISGAMMRFNTVNNGSEGHEFMDSPMMDLPNSLIGNNFANNININTVKTKKKHYQPVTFGLSFKFDMDNDWAVETGLTYTYLYSKLESGSVGNIIHQQQSLYYVGIPLVFSRNLLKIGNVNFYGSAGGEVEKCISGKQKTFNLENGVDKQTSTDNLDIKQLQMSLSSSLGVEYRLAGNMSVYTEPGIVYYFDDKSGIETIRNEHPFNFNIKLGLRFTFTK